MSTVAGPPRPFRIGLAFAVAVSATVGIVACEREPLPSAGPLAVVADKSPIDFPPEVQADDPAVNQFVRQITETCVEGDYERFRLLWAVREDPFPRREFERGWKALNKVRVIALQKMKTKAGEYLYYLHARVELDESVPEPEREVVLLIVKENDRWRLAKAPAHLIKQVLGTGDDGNANLNS